MAAQERKRSPIAIKPAGSITTTDGLVQATYWMRAKNMPTKFHASFQKVCIQSYINYSATEAVGFTVRPRIYIGPEFVSLLGFYSDRTQQIYYVPLVSEMPLAVRDYTVVQRRPIGLV